MAPVGLGKEALKRIKADLDACVGKRVRFRVHQGRRRFIEGEGVLEGTHRHLFVIRLGHAGAFTSRVSYSYADILTRMVEVAVESKEYPAHAPPGGNAHIRRRRP